MCIKPLTSDVPCPIHATVSMKWTVIFKSILFYYSYYHVNLESTESPELVTAVFTCIGWTRSNAQHLTHITVSLSFYEPIYLF